MLLLLRITRSRSPRFLMTDSDGVGYDEDTDKKWYEQELQRHGTRTYLILFQELT